MVAGLLLLPMRKENAPALRWTALAISLVDLALCLPLLAGFQGGQAGMQFYENFPWVPNWGINYRLGVDGISLFLVVLNSFLAPVAILASWKAIENRVKPFLFLLLVLETAVHGVFLSQDVFLFYLFWEASLIPMYFLIGVWGGERRIYATLKFVLYTLSGSLLMLVAILYLYFKAGSFDLAWWKTLSLSATEQAWLFAAFFLAFAIKVPLFPLHTWLPDAHVEAPTAGSILLAGVLLKLGSYGILRFCQPLFPAACLAFQPFITTLCLIGILYGAVMVLVQTDFKKMVAYSSVSHMGLCILGLFSFNLYGQQGSVLTMVNHGISTGALFLIVGMFYERVHTRDLSQYGGAVARMPVMGLLFLPVALSSMGVPGTNGFVNEFLVLWGSFTAKPMAGFLAAIGIILGAAYMLRLTQKVMLGPLGSDLMSHLTDLDWRERVTLGALVILILWLGIYPNAALSRIEPSLRENLVRMAGTSLALH
jgi:NADH-quinone oxidoreductase subunit M